MFGMLIFPILCCSWVYLANIFLKIVQSKCFSALLPHCQRILYSYLIIYSLTVLAQQDGIHCTAVFSLVDGSDGLRSRLFHHVIVIYWNVGQHNFRCYTLCAILSCIYQLLRIAHVWWVTIKIYLLTYLLTYKFIFWTAHFDCTAR